MLKNNKILNVVCLGGGSGLSHLARGIRHVDHINLTCIVTVADNGGSTGILKKEYQMPAVGDIRNVLLSLSNAPEMLDKMFDYRFEVGTLSGHSLGNIMMAGLYQANNCDFVKTVESMSEVFNVSGKVIPATQQVVEIQAIMEDNSFIYGESLIGQKAPNQRIKRIFYNQAVNATDSAIQAIREADIIIYSIGSLYTSLIPNLIIPRIAKAIKESKALKLYFSNLMTQPNETDDYTLSDHVDAINTHLGFQGIDVIVVNNKSYSPDILEKYEEEGSYPVKCDVENIDKSIRILPYDIAKISQENKISHSKQQIRKLLGDDIKCLFPEM